MKVLRFVIFAFILSNISYSQIDTTIWYPLEVGNRWEFNYYVSVSESFSINIEVVDDTLINDKTYYKMRIDNNIVFQRVEDNEKVWEYSALTNSEYIRYDFSRPDKSIWNLDSPKNQYGVYHTYPIYINIYGDTLKSKVYNSAYIDSRYSPPDTVWAPMVDGLAIIVTKGLGITEYGQGINNGSFTGAIINGNTLGTLTSVKDNRLNGASYNVSQNYPNPFNPNTNIEFTIPEREYVELNLYNSLGQKVKILLNKVISGGHHSVRFSGENYSSGIYYYQLKTNKYSIVRKMLLLK